MATKIEWCDEVWNPICGCSEISEGCKNCYAKKFAKRLKRLPKYRNSHKWDGAIGFDWKEFEKPSRWKKPRRIFVCSMGDLFHENVPAAYVQDIFNVMWKEERHTFLILTKRPERMLRILPTCRYPLGHKWEDDPPRNVWLGVTCENQKRLDERWPILLQIPAAVRFVSCEPLLEAFSIAKWYKEIDWLICGAETGPGARYMSPNSAKAMQLQCKTYNIPFFMKKMSNKVPVPKDLNVREFPKEIK